MTSGDVPEMRLRTEISSNSSLLRVSNQLLHGTHPSSKPKNSIWTEVSSSLAVHRSQDSGIVGADFRSCGRRETAQDHTVREVSERGRGSGCALDTCFELFKFRAFFCGDLCLHFGGHVALLRVCAHNLQDVSWHAPQHFCMYPIGFPTGVIWRLRVSTPSL